MVVCLLWDAINDPMMGIIIENSHLKAGKFKHSGTGRWSA